MKDGHTLWEWILLKWSIVGIVVALVLGVFTFGTEVRSLYIGWIAGLTAFLSLPFGTAYVTSRRRRGFDDEYSSLFLPVAATIAGIAIMWMHAFRL